MENSYKILNTTNNLQAPGYFLDFNGQTFGPGRQITVHQMSDVIMQWVAEGKVHAMKSNGEAIGSVASSSVALTPFNRLHEVTQTEFSEDEDDINLSDANDAALPRTEATAGIMQSTSQSYDNKAHVSIGLTEENNTNNSLATSPIPGNKPVSVDDSDKFTVKAPRTTSVGAVIK